MQQQYIAQRNREQLGFDWNVHSPTIPDRANMWLPSEEVQSNLMYFTKSDDDLRDKQRRESKTKYKRYECARFETLLFIIVLDSCAFSDVLVAIFVVVVLVVEPSWLAC